MKQSCEFRQDIDLVRNVLEDFLVFDIPKDMRKQVLKILKELEVLWDLAPNGSVPKIKFK